MKCELSGIIVIDKPAGFSSAGVVAAVKKILKAGKVGHTGTLDPFATGVMVCCLNKATRLSRFFLQGDKKYRARLQLGVETDTQDLTGTVTRTHDVGRIADTTVRSVFNGFVGDIHQVPPAYSALKHNGVPLYKLARGGKPIRKAARRIRIEKIDILDLEPPGVTFEVDCSAGTYIRTLAADIGNVLGCGAHLDQLRRIECCGFDVENAVTLEALERLVDSGEVAGSIIGMSDALPEMAERFAGNDLIKSLRHGAAMTTEDIFPPPHDAPEGWVKVVDATGALVAVLSHTSGSATYKYCCVF
jgi:tRNA pseudouridine55 synthase